MADYEITVDFSNVGDRNAVRMRIVEQLSKEFPGKGKGDLATHYTYYVETLKDDKRIYLRRPANLHNGFDFVVCVEGINFNKGGRYRDYPKHEDILDDLRAKKKENYQLYDSLFSMIRKVYKCSHVDLDAASKIQFNTGYPCDLIVGVIKWFFIEQDIRYWNYSGRDMLWEGLSSI